MRGWFHTESDIMIKYSVLVPVYNVEDYLPKCVESILDQDYQGGDYEIILVDDGSTDSSGPICDSYSERFENVITIHQENKGLLLARAAGVRASGGQYLIFVDSDDYIDIWFLSYIDKYIELLAPDFVVYGYVEERKTGQKHCPVTRQEYEVYDKLRFLDSFVRTDSLNSIWNKVVRSEILRDRADEVYSLQTNIGEDKLQTAHLIMHSDNIVFLGECPYHYVLRGSSIAHHKSEKDIYNMISVYEKVGEIVRNVLKQEEIAEPESGKIVDKYRSVALDGILDHIYKYNNRADIIDADKCKAIERITAHNAEFFAIDRNIQRKLRLYNKIRYNILRSENYEMLIRLDHMLKKIQKIANAR